MSVKLMSAIFETEFRDIEDPEGNTTKASTAKLVLLAMADHANDEGEGAYPSIEKLTVKTALSPQTIRNTFDALRHNGVISLVGTSKYRTNNHTINVRCFPRMRGDDDGALTLYPLDPLMSTVDPLMSTVDPLTVRPESLLTIKEPLAKNEKKSAIPANSDMSFLLAGGVSSEAIAEMGESERRRREIADLYERLMGYNPLPWWTDRKLGKLLEFLASRPEREIRGFAWWSKRPFSPLGPTKARQNPELVIECWPLSIAPDPGAEYEPM